MAIPNGKPATGIPVFYTLTKIHKPNPVGRQYLAEIAQQNESSAHHLLIISFSLSLKFKNHTLKTQQIS